MSRYALQIITDPDDLDAGPYVSFYDPDEHDGAGRLAVTNDPEKALTWPTFQAAVEAYRTQSTVTPLRADGQPNRPLTAYTVTIVRLS